MVTLKPNCKHCGSTNTIKDGREKNGNQRIECKDCKRKTILGGKPNLNDYTNKEELKERNITQEFSSESGKIEVKSFNIKTVEDALALAKVDMEIWEVSSHKISSAEVTMRLRKYSKNEDGSFTRINDHPATYTNWNVQIWLQRRIPFGGLIYIFFTTEGSVFMMKLLLGRFESSKFSFIRSISSKFAEKSKRKVGSS